MVLKSKTFCSVASPGVYYNTLRSEQNDAVLQSSQKCIFLNENDSILSKNSLKLVSRHPVDIKLSLVHVKAWC